MIPPSLAGRRDTLCQLVATQLGHRLDRLIEAAMAAGADAHRRQWDQMVDALPADARDAYGAGIWQAIMVAQDVRGRGGTPQEIVDRLMAMAVFAASEVERGES